MNLPGLVNRAAQAGLRVEFTDGIARLALHREGGNRISFALLEILTQVLAELATSAELRAAVLTASGSDFSFGADLSDHRMAELVSGTRDDRIALAKLGQQAVDAWATLPVPTLAAARGRIVGAGACFFCTADFSYATAEALVTFPEVDRGMHLSWGIIPRLAARLGLAHAAQLTLTGEPVACGQLPQPPLHITSNPEAAAMAQAQAFAAKPPLAVRAIKRVLVATAERLQEAAGQDAAYFADTIGSADFGEAMAAWFEKRPGKYIGR